MKQLHVEAEGYNVQLLLQVLLLLLLLPLMNPPTAMLFVPLILVVLAALVSSVEAFSSTATTIRPGDKLPWVDLHWGFNPPTFVNLPTYCGSRNVIVVGVPGAFVDNRQIPSYMEHSDKLKELGIEEVIVSAVNDGAVMGVWQNIVNTEGTILTFLADPFGAFTDQCGTRNTNPQWEKKGLIGRSKPFAMYVQNCIVKHVAVAESNDDSDGEGDESTTLALAMMEVVKHVSQAEAEAEAEASQITQ